MAKTKAQKKSSKLKIFVAIGVGVYEDVVSATGFTRNDALGNFDDYDGKSVRHIVEIELPKIKRDDEKIPTTKVTVTE